MNLTNNPSCSMPSTPAPVDVAGRRIYGQLFLPITGKKKPMAQAGLESFILYLVPLNAFKTSSFKFGEEKVTIPTMQDLAK